MTGVMGVVRVGILLPDQRGDSGGAGGRGMVEGRGERIGETPDITIHDPDDVIGGVAGGESGERATGTPNIIYNLSSVLFHALQGGASYDTYVEDAEREADEELAEFFRRVREEDRDRASEAQLLLAKRTLTAPGTEDTALDAAATEGTAPGVAATADSEPDLPPATESPGRAGTASGVPMTEDLTPGVAATEGSEPDVSPGTDPPGSLPDTEPRAEGAPLGDARREDVVAGMPDEEDITSPEEVVPPDAQGQPGGAPSRAEAGQSPRTEPISAPPEEGDVPPRRTEEATSPRPEPSDDFPGTEPVLEDVAKERTGEVPPPEEIPPERAGEIPTAEEVPPPRTQNVPGAEQVPSGTPPQAPPGDVQGEQPSSRIEEATQAGQDASRQNEGDQEDKGLLDEIKDAILGEEERGREETDRPRRG